MKSPSVGRNEFDRHRGGFRAWNLTIMTGFAAVMLGGSLGAQVVRFDQIDITVQTGGDDLRKSSSATATLECAERLPDSGHQLEGA